mmetsp:Transcript_8348/g.23403  ORF Transcript_8348/g.23403 Transcript_8348/m.23403 type:complete len:245 (+) Transcript_8348:203-937(+)
MAGNVVHTQPASIARARRTTTIGQGNQAEHLAATAEHMRATEGCSTTGQNMPRSSSHRAIEAGQQHRLTATNSAVSEATLRTAIATWAPGALSNVIASASEGGRARRSIERRPASGCHGTGVRQGGRAPAGAPAPAERAKAAAARRPGAAAGRPAACAPAARAGPVEPAQRRSPPWAAGRSRGAPAGSPGSPCSATPSARARPRAPGRAGGSPPAGALAPTQEARPLRQAGCPWPRPKPWRCKA